MNVQHNKNRIIILVIFAMSIIPFSIAWYLAKHPGEVKLGTNNGDLINPPISTSLVDFTGFDGFSIENIKQLQGHWVLINLIPVDECAESCQEGLYKTNQVTLMMGKDIARIRRLALSTNQTSLPLPAQWQADARLLKALPSAQLRKSLTKISTTSVPGELLIMDPLGNLMMKYESGYDPYQVRNDLSKLLRISQIG